MWHKRLGHPNKYVMQHVKNIEEAGVNFTNSCSTSYIRKIYKSTQRNHRKTAHSGDITERLQLVSTN